MKPRLGPIALLPLLAASAALAQNLPEQVPVKRTDGTIVYPNAAGSGAAEGTVMRPDGTNVFPGAAGTGRTEPIAVKRPDGSVVHPAIADERAPRPSSAVRVDERERMRKETQQSLEQRTEQNRREREAAAASPARKLPSTQDR